MRYADRALLIRDGGTLATGPVAKVLAKQQLELLYQAGVEELADAQGGGRAFLPS